jgi:hypothetical protein
MIELRGATPARGGVSSKASSKGGGCGKDRGKGSSSWEPQLEHQAGLEGKPGLPTNSLLLSHSVQAGAQFVPKP